MEPRSIEVKGKTVDESIFNGLKELGRSIDEVDIEIISEGGKGFLGLSKSIVRITEKCEEMTVAGQAEGFLDKLFSLMHISATAEVEDTDEALEINLVGDSTGVLIGRRGETLDALQYITSLVVNRDQDTYKRVLMDTENYRRKREETLVRLANRIAAKVAKTGRRVALEPMNPYECRILHATLQNHPKVETISEGEEPFRRVVVRRRRHS